MAGVTARVNRHEPASAEITHAAPLARRYCVCLQIVGHLGSNTKTAVTALACHKLVVDTGNYKGLLTPVQLASGTLEAQHCHSLTMKAVARAGCRPVGAAAQAQGPCDRTRKMNKSGAKLARGHAAL